MELKEAKEVLSAIGYPVKGSDWEDLIADLQCSYGSTRVGSSMNTLGDAAPLFVKSSNVAFMVDNPNDLCRACRQIKAVLEQRKAREPVVLKVDERSRVLPDILYALESEITSAGRCGRDLGIVDTEYRILFSEETRIQTRKPAQIMNDLLSTDRKRNVKAVEALQRILIIKPAEAA